MKTYLFILLSIFSFVSEAFLVLSNEEMPLTCYDNNQIVIYVNGNEFTFDKILTIKLLSDLQFPILQFLS